ncbi:MAG: hypothetical protein Fues2KO_54350 [Fuerstiella sp.]
MERIRNLTAERKLLWAADDDGWFTATVDNRPVSFRLLYYEATNQPGADPRMFEVTMPGFNHVFSFGTEGASILLEILAEADLGFPDYGDGLDIANRLLDTLDGGSSPRTSN